MLARASLPLLRSRSLPLSTQTALPQTQLRSYAYSNAKSRARRLEQQTSYKLPSSAVLPAWQNSSSFASNSRSEDNQNSTNRIRPVPRAPNEFLRPRASYATKGDEKGAESGYSKPSRERPPPIEEPEPLNPPQEPSGNVQQSEILDPDSDSVPTGPLPDLTRGIPSTLDAELSQARAKRGSSTASLNITEDPSEPLPGEEDSQGPRIPRSEYVSSSDKRKNTAFRYVYLLLALGVSGYSAYLGRNWDTEEEERQHPAAPSGWGFGLLYNRIRARLGSTMSYYNDPVTNKLLPDEETDPNYRMPFTLVLSLEDLLIHQEWTRSAGWRIAKRPGLDYFLRYLSQYYELVLFTSQPSAMADQVLRKLDPYSTIRWPLFREATLYQDGGYIKDLSYLNRDLKKVIIVDTDPHHVKNQPENAIVLPKWKGDPQDQTLVQLIPFLEYLANMGFDDARTVLKSFEGKFIPAEFARREKLLREKFEAQEAEKRKKRPKKSVGIGSLFGTKQQSPDGLPSSEEAAAEGKMLWDLIRERGQKNYMEFEKKIQEEGAKWLADREAEEKRAQEEAMKSMTTGFLGGFFGGGGEKK